MRRTIAFVVVVLTLLTIAYYMHLSGAIATDFLPSFGGNGTETGGPEAPDATEIVEQVVQVEAGAPVPPGVIIVTQDDPALTDAAKPNGVVERSVQYSSGGGRNQLQAGSVPMVASPSNRGASRAAYDPFDKPGPPELNSSVRLATRQDLERGDLEFIRDLQPQYFYLKTKEELHEKWMKTAADRGTTTSETVKMACLYAGFVRDFENMFVGCRDKKDSTFCSKSKLRKFFGNQREYLLDSTDCDVYLSTWDIRGGGRFSTTKYDMKETVDGARVKYYYRHRMAGLHVQRYADYQHVWRYMHKFRRNFPQMRPTSAKHDRAGEESWTGRHETNELLRLNDYSQSYKQWAVVQLVARTGFKYDLYYRLRCDLRMTSKLSNFQFDAADRSKIHFEILQVEREEDKKARKRLMAGGGGGTAGGKALADEDDDIKKVLTADSAQDDDKVTEVNITRRHFVTPTRIHTSNFDIADFGFMGTPEVIEKLTHVWWLCLEPSADWVPSIAGKAISEYNLMVWRIIFDSKWEVDSGGRYLWVSRRHGMNPKNAGTTVIIKKIIIRKKPRRR